MATLVAVVVAMAAGLAAWLLLAGEEDGPRDTGKLAKAVLRDRPGGPIVARPVSSEPLSEEEFLTRADQEPEFQSQLALTREFGFTGFHNASAVTFDDGTLVTAGVFSRGNQKAIVLHARGPRSGTLTIRPELSQAGLTSLQLLSADGWVLMDLATGESTSDDFHQSCSYGNCLMGALYFWLEEDEWWDFIWDSCDACFDVPAAAEVMCPVCAISLGAPALASAAFCAIDSCDLCYDDDCADAGVVDRRCVTGVGPTGFAIVETVRDPVCENARQQDSQCTWSDTDRMVEPCYLGCAPVAPGDTASRACLQASCTTAADCPGVVTHGTPACVPQPGYSPAAWLTSPFTSFVCGSGGTCQPVTGAGWPVGSCEIGCMADLSACFSGCPESTVQPPRWINTDKRPSAPPKWVLVNPWTCSQDTNGVWFSNKPWEIWTPREVAPGRFTCEKSSSYIAERCAGACEAGACVPVTPTPTPTPTSTPMRTPSPARTPLPTRTLTPEQTFVVAGKAYEAISPDLFQPCANCVIRITGIGGTWTTTTSSSGTFSIGGVREGNYRIERQCREVYESQVVTVWKAALAPQESSAVTHANVNAPRTSQADILLPGCPAVPPGR
ncbi:MAG: hypothetical protein HS107_07535 [Thermoflexaceae bacterium]|nr:hypothetical protein [Thermoflexaceae bacterium]